MAIGDVLSFIDAGTMILGIFFLAIFGLLMWVIGKFIKDNTTIQTVIAFALALGATWGITQSSFNLTDIFYSIPGISLETIYIIGPILFLGFLFIIGLKKVKTGQIDVNGKPKKKRKFSFSRMFMILGLLFVIVSFTPLIFEKTTVLITGIGLFLVGIILKFVKKIFKKKGKSNSGNLNNSNNANPNQSRSDRINAQRQNEKTKAQLDQEWAEQQQRENAKRIKAQKKQQKRAMLKQRAEQKRAERLARKQGLNPQEISQATSQKRGKVSGRKAMLQRTYNDKKSQKEMQRQQEDISKEQKRLSQIWTEDNKKLRRLSQEIADQSLGLREDPRKRRDYMRKINSIRSELYKKYSSRNWSKNIQIEKEVNEISDNIKGFLDQLENFLHSLTK